MPIIVAIMMNRVSPAPRSEPASTMVRANGTCSKRDDLQESRSQLDHRFIAGERAQQGIGKKEKHDAHGGHDERRQPVRFPVFEFGPGVFAGADTLPDHGGGGDGKAVARQERERFN
jgi:hypothetical protein